MTHTRFHISLFASLLAIHAAAQENLGSSNGITVSGSVQANVLLPQTDEKINTEEADHWKQGNMYAEVNAMSKYVDAGVRFEYMRHPLFGYENDFKGWGVPYFYVKGHIDKAELTLGSFYEQFGSGFILRTYEERNLGIDNSLMGGRLVVKPVNGITLKALAGRQRRYWDWNKGLVSGADLELNVDQWLKGFQKHNTYLTLGASWVNKYEKEEDLKVDATHKLNFPKYVNSFDVRANLQTGNWGILGEYAWKTDDPSFDNGYIYRKGNVAMLSTTYSRRGLSVLLQAKRSDCMSFRSKRSMSGTSSFINHLPAFTMEHTYALAALYPYATHPDGEWAYQAELGYKFKRNTVLGGKYGTEVKFNYSHVHSLDRSTDKVGMGTSGASSSFFGWGNSTYYQDLNVQLSKKFSRSFNLSLMYMNQFYNKTVVEGEGGMIRSDIYIAEGKYRFNNKLTLRGEAQYLHTAEDQGDWMYGLLELSVLPNWMFTISDMYNSGETNLHYYQGYVTFSHGSHRLQLGYGRTRAGYNCSGGVCRWVPASKGFTLAYNYNF